MTKLTRNHFWARAAVLLFIILLTVLLVAFPPTIEAPSETPSTSEEQTDAPATATVNQLVPSPAPAIHLSQWWNEAVAERDLDLVNELGFRWVKQTFAWRDIEGWGKDLYDWTRADIFVDMATERDLYIIARLDRQPEWAEGDADEITLENAPPADLTDFEDYCFAIADRYQGRIQAYQVWNEPNLTREWGGQPPDPAAYVDLLAHCYRGIRRGDPDAIVISAGLAPTGTGLPLAMPDDEFLQGMYDAGAAEYFDMLGVNAPGYKAPPWVSAEEVAQSAEYGGHRWAAFRHVEDIREIMVQNGDAEKQIAIMEMGWTLDPINEEYSWFAVTEQEQAEYLEAAYWWARMNWTPWIGFMTTIYISDHYWTPEDEQYWWSITLPQYPHSERREAFWRLQGLPDWGNSFYED